MFIRITGVLNTEPVHETCVLRAVTNWGLKDSKNFRDAVANGSHLLLWVANAQVAKVLKEAGYSYEVDGRTASYGREFAPDIEVLMELRIVQNFLYEAPRYITIQQALDLLTPFRTGSVS